MKKQIDKLKQEMFEEWLWDEWYNELRAKAIEQEEEKAGFFKSILGIKTKISEKHNKLFEERLKELKK